VPEQRGVKIFIQLYPGIPSTSLSRLPRLQMGLSGLGPGEAVRTFLYALCAVVWMSLIFYLSSLPGSKLGPNTEIINLIKKMGHFAIFGILAGLYLFMFRGEKSLSDTRGLFFLLSFILVVLYAITDEYHQSFTPGRHSSGKDVVIDACGALTVLVILNVLKTREKWKHEGN
jgi:VanZ family protein